MNNNEIKLLLDELYSVNIKDFNGGITIGNELKIFGNGEFIIMYRKDNQNFNFMNLDIDISDKNIVNIKGKGENKMKDIKDMLKSGDKTPDELRAILEKEIAAAQKELDRENTKASPLDLARFDFLEAVSKYGEELGIIEKGSVDEDMMRAAAQTLEELEPDIKKYAKILDILFSDDEEEEEEEKEQPAAWIPTSLTKYGVDIAPVDLDSKLSDLIKGLMKE